MTAISRLKPASAEPKLECLGALVAAVQARLNVYSSRLLWDKALNEWPETIELARSIEHDDGWQLHVAHRGRVDESLYLYLDAPQLFLRYSTAGEIEVAPPGPWWPHQFRYSIFRDATHARYKRLGCETPHYNEKILTEMRARRWFQWGRP